MDTDFINLPLDRVHRLGPYKKNKVSDSRTIVVKFANYAHRELIWALRNAMTGHSHLGEGGLSS